MDVSPDRVFDYAHGLNNLLAAIAGFAALAGRRLVSDPADVAALQQAIDEINVASLQAARLTRTLVDEAATGTATS